MFVHKTRFYHAVGTGEGHVFEYRNKKVANVKFMTLDHCKEIKRFSRV